MLSGMRRCLFVFVCSVSFRFCVVLVVPFTFLRLAFMCATARSLICVLFVLDPLACDSSADKHVGRGWSCTARLPGSYLLCYLLGYLL